jgi:hypothetical protein
MRYLSGVKCFPSNGKLTVNLSAIDSDSLLLANYVMGSHGTEITVDDQGSGWATFTGTAGKKFRFIVFDD